MRQERMRGRPIPRNEFNRMVAKYGYDAAVGLASIVMESGRKTVSKWWNKKSTRSSRSSGSYRRPAKPVYKQVKGMKKQISQLKKIAESDQGTHIHRIKRGGDQVTAAANRSHFAVYSHNQVSFLEAALAELRYYDPSVPGTLVNADGTTGTFHKDFYFRKTYHKCTVRNNYQVPARVTLYNFVVKSDTSISPSAAFTQGLTDVGNPLSTSPMVYPTDSPQLLDLYTIKQTKSRLLQPGQEMSIIHSTKPFLYDPSFVDSHTLTYIKAFGGGAFGVRVEGVVGHDTTADEQGLLNAGVDVEVDHRFEIVYAAGADIKYITLDDQMSSFTNSGVVSNNFGVDNVPYSKA